MGFEDREWYRKELKERERRARAAGNPRRVFSPLNIVLALLAAATLAFAVLAWVLQSRAESAAELRVRSVPNALHESQLEDQKLQREAGEREAARQALLQQQDAQRQQAIVERQRADEEALRAQAEAVDRKAKAWEKFYRKPAVCNDATTMECANAYIRAKRVFEEKYARGEL